MLCSSYLPTSGVDACADHRDNDTGGGDRPGAEIEEWIAGGGDVVHELRRHTLDVLSRWSAPAATICDAVVCIDKLARDIAHRGAATAIGLRIVRFDGFLRILVFEDLSPDDVALSANNFASLLATPPASTAQRWGVTRDQGHSTVWFQLSLSPGDEPAERAQRADRQRGRGPAAIERLERLERPERPERHAAAITHPLRLAAHVSGGQQGTGQQGTGQQGTGQQGTGQHGGGQHGADTALTGEVARVGTDPGRPAHRVDVDVRVDGPQDEPHPLSPVNSLIAGNLHIDLVSRSVRVGNQAEPVRLTGREFELLVHLVRRAGQIQSRRELLRDVWRIDFPADTAVVEVTMSRLRRKLGSPDLRTIKDAGYVFGAAYDPVPAPPDTAGDGLPAGQPRWQVRQA